MDNWFLMPNGHWVNYVAKTSKRNIWTLLCVTKGKKISPQTLQEANVQKAGNATMSLDSVLLGHDAGPGLELGANASRRLCNGQWRRGCSSCPLRPPCSTHLPPTSTPPDTAFWALASAMQPPTMSTSSDNAILTYPCTCSKLLTLGVTTIITLIILLPLQVICIFLHKSFHLLSGLSGHKMLVCTIKWTRDVSVHHDLRHFISLHECWPKTSLKKKSHPS